MMPNNPLQGMEYFAQLTDKKAYVEASKEKIASWRQHCSGKGLHGLWMRKLSNYYGISEDSYSSMLVISSGTEGELSNLKINDLYNLVQNQLIVITSVRPAGIARAINSDPETLRRAKIGTALSEYYLSQEGWEKVFVTAAEIALIVDEAWVENYWDKDAGTPVRPDIDPATGQVDPNKPEMMSGDAKIRVHCPWNVARDPDMGVDSQTWHIVSVLENRFDLAAKYPDFKEQILTANQDDVPQLKLQERKGTDNVYVHHVMHDRTPGVPKGRYSMIVGDVLLADMDLPYPRYPLRHLSPGDTIDGPTGFCPSNNVMAIEQSTDSLHSSILTNNLTFGGQSLVGPPLAGVQVQEIAKGMRYFELPPDQVDKLMPLQLTKSAPETFTYIGTLEAKKQELMGSMTGTLQAQATQGASGSAMALIQSQAIQFNSGTQRSYFRMLSDVMTSTIEMLRVYADTPRIARIVGKSKAMGLKEFKFNGEDLNAISSIVFEVVNPFMQTYGGRVDAAKDLLSNGLLTSAKQYLTLLETGNSEPLISPDEDAQILILEENEKLSQGQGVMVLITENHADHIKGHLSTLSTPEGKGDPMVVNATLGHIQEHINVWQQASMTNPAILIATGQQPLPPMPQPMAPIPLGPLPPGGGSSPPPSGGPPSAPNQALGEMQPKQPNLPTNPATGEKPAIPGVNAISQGA